MSIVKFSLCAAVALAATAAASAELVAGWTMPTAFPTGTGSVPTGTTYLPPGPNGAGVADQGVNIAGSQLSAFHAVAAATYTSPSGNGSQYAFSSNNWSIGDYYEAILSTTGYTGMTLSWDQARSSTGPAAFEMIYSVDGGANFITALSYTVLQSGGGGAPGTWSSLTYNSLYTTTFDFAGAIDNQAQVIVRFRATGAAGGATGSNRIDSVMFNSTVPTPGAIALLGLAGVAARRRRR